jgi:isoleucyl-tRNA synthetase
MIFDDVAYKTCVSNGLVLDRDGNKMSKRLGNAADPFQTIDKYGPDATRWYMITNAQPWDNLKFDLNGVAEVQRKFFGTLHNTYAFFALLNPNHPITLTETIITTAKSENNFFSPTDKPEILFVEHIIIIEQITDMQKSFTVYFI